MAHQTQHGKSGAGGRPNASINFAKDFKKEWITGEFTPDTISFAEGFGKFLANNGMTTSQIRNVYGEVMRISVKGVKKAYKDFLLLKPKIAYATKRKATSGIEKFKEVMDLAHEAVVGAVEQETAFQNFKDFFEAVLAYHKAAGGKE